MLAGLLALRKKKEGGRARPMRRGMILCAGARNCLGHGRGSTNLPASSRPGPGERKLKREKEWRRSRTIGVRHGPRLAWGSWFLPWVDTKTKRKGQRLCCSVLRDLVSSPFSAAMRRSRGGEKKKKEKRAATWFRSSNRGVKEPKGGLHHPCAGNWGGEGGGGEEPSLFAHQFRRNALGAHEGILKRGESSFVY